MYQPSPLFQPDAMPQILFTEKSVMLKCSCFSGEETETWSFFFLKVTPPLDAESGFESQMPPATSLLEPSTGI